jgi:hypothetical protein
MLYRDKIPKSDAVKSSSTILIAGSLFFLLVVPFTVVPLVKADLSPSVRSVSIESKSGSQLTVDWAIFKVGSWGDQIKFNFWVIRGPEHYFIGSCGVGLCDTFYSQPDGEMSHPGYSSMGVYRSDGVMALLATAEMPFDIRQETHPIDGLQTYYYSKVHVVFNFVFKSDDVILVGADYQNTTQYYSGGFPYYGPQNTGDYYEATYSSIPDGNNPFPSNPPPITTSTPVENFDSNSSVATPTPAPTLAPTCAQDPTDSPQMYTAPDAATPTPSQNLTTACSENPTVSPPPLENKTVPSYSIIPIFLAFSGLCVGIVIYKKHSAS